MALRPLDLDGTPWFVAADVCKVLSLAKVDRATAPIGSDEKGTHPMSTPGGTQRLTTISESGLYKLVMRSDKEAAREFQGARGAG